MSLIVRFSEEVAHVEFNHGKANEMGTEQLQAFESLCDEIEAGRCRVRVAHPPSAWSPPA